MTERKPYYLGLALDDTSIGWALTDPAYNLLRASRKDAWGTRLFSAPETAEKARAARCARRTLHRKQRNINFLKQVFEDEIKKVDPMFLTRLEESKLYLEDRSAGNKQKNGVFCDVDFDDAAYFERYPTFFHLNKDLMTTTEPRDVRLVYLALLNYFKHRGHFYAKAISADNGVVDIAEAYKEMQESAAFEGISLTDVDDKKLVDTLCDTKHSPSAIEKSLEKLLDLKAGKEDAPAKELCKLICGLTGRVDKLFPTQFLDVDEKVAISFKSETADEELDGLGATLTGDAMHVLELAQAINNARQLHEILGSEQYYTFAQIRSYEDHAYDRYMLKTVLNKYDHEVYRKMFYGNTPNSYSGYVNQNNWEKPNGKRIRRRRLFEKNAEYAARSQESFHKNVLAVLNKLPAEAADDPMVKAIRERIDAGVFMPKQRTRDNAIVPNQLLAVEVKLILDNASHYLPFLNKKDAEYGLTNKEKLIQLFSFTLPYFVGPIPKEGDKGSRFAWSTYRPGKGGAIYPWNLEEKVDLNRSAKLFINNLVGQCTYLSDQKVLPRGSMLYEKYLVLNDLNSIKISGEKISVEAKQKLFTDLYMAGGKVSHASLVKHLKDIGAASEEDVEHLTYSGSYQGPTCYMSSLGKFKKIFTDEFIGSHYDVLEDIIFLSTVFGENSKDRLEDEIFGKYGKLFSQEEIEKMLKLSFTGWGSFSREFLTLNGRAEVDGAAKDLGTRSIIDMMWYTNNTLQELLYSDFSYGYEIESRSKDNKFSSLKDWDIEELNKQYIHVGLKKTLWQARAIILDVERVMGYPPAKIFIQRARGGQPPKKTNRKKELLDLYKKVHDPERDWVSEIEALDESDLRSRNMYLYYLQMGRCMYTGKKISLEDLKTGKYDRDHIFPKSKTDDNSITNLVLVDQEYNREKSDEYPLDKKIQEKMKDFWKKLVDLKFMSNEKYERLTREKSLTEDELAEYINKRMKDNRPGTKTAYRLLKAAYKNTDTEVIFTNSSLVADFRNMYKLQEATVVNNQHQARDAYLNIVCGNVYNAKFSADTHLYLYKNKDKNRSYNLSRMYDKDVLDGSLVVWKAEDKETGEEGTIQKVRTTLKRTTSLLTRMPDFVDDELFDETVYSKKTVKTSATPSVYVPLKKGMETEKYGGKRRAKVAYYALCSYTKVTKKENQRIRSLLPVLSMWRIKPGQKGETERLEELLTQSLNAELKGSTKIIKVKVIEYPILQQSKLQINGFQYWLGGKAGSLSSLSWYARQAFPLYVPEEMSAYIKKIEKACERKSFDEVDQERNPVLSKKKNLECYDHLIEKLTTGVFVKMACNIVNVLIAGRNKFKTLELEKQCQLLLDLFIWMNGNKQAVNLSPIDGKPTAGVMTISANVSAADEAIIIKESATGLSSRKFSLKG